MIENFEGIKKAIEETKKFDRILTETYKRTAIEVYGGVETPGIVAFPYGSPGRIELVGGDSDADILLVENPRTEKTIKFRKKLIERLKEFDFSKVDTPTWGTFEEITPYLKKSLVEGNQILEARFLIGDERIKKELELFKVKFGIVERELMNIISNRFYFNQYFRQRSRGQVPNIKYCHGGSRDFLFIDWWDRLERRNTREEGRAYLPRFILGLERLFEKGKINWNELLDALKAFSFLTILRSDVLLLNKNTPDRGLTFLGEDTAKRLEGVGYPLSNKTISYFNKCRKAIDQTVQEVWEEVIKKAESRRYKGWSEEFRKAYDGKISYNEKAKIDSEDPFMRTALIWGASESSQKKLFDHLVEKYKDTTDWGTINAIACSPLCSSRVLYHLGIGIGKEKGYGYLLRVITRNKNISRETLEAIAYDSKLEKRYTEVAQAVLEKGNGAANNTI